VSLLRYTRGLKFEEKPNYGYIKQLLKDMFVGHNYIYDYAFDWIAPLLKSEFKSQVMRHYSMKDQPHYRELSPPKVHTKSKSKVKVMPNNDSLAVNFSLYVKTDDQNKNLATESKDLDAKNK